MQFLSIQYIVCFTILFWLYWLFCKGQKSQNIVLLIASYLFYGLYDWRCVPLLLATSLVAYGAGMYFRHDNNGKLLLGRSSRWWVSTGAIFISLVILGYFKYANFFLQSINDITGGGKFEPLNIVLPVGISFYTFSAISYIVDCYQKKIEPTTDIVAGLLFTSFFPAIMSGPIHKATEQLPQYFKRRIFDDKLVIFGFKDFLWGAFMKACVADRLGMYVDAVYGNLAQHNGTSVLLASFFYTIQIYADFAGYSLMAIGSGKMLGIRLQTNFIRPYFSKTITEFWSKWHMSLTGWFKNYVYIPLGGNRVGKARWILNIMIVFLLSGFWHGAAYTFIIWGAIHGIAQVLEKLIYGKRIKQIESKINTSNLMRMAVTFCIVSFAWMFFRLPSLGDAMSAIRQVFTSVGTPYLDMHTLVFAFISFAIMLFKDVCDEWLPKVRMLNSDKVWISFATCVILVAYILLMGKLDSGSFIYFQF